MTKSEFVDRVADSSGLSKKDATTAVDAVIRSIEDALKSGEDVTSPASGSSTSPSAAPARAATRVPARRCRSPRAACPASPRAPASRRRSARRPDGRRFVGRRRSVARHALRRPPRRGGRGARSQVVLGLDPDPARLWPGRWRRRRVRAALSAALASAERIAAHALRVRGRGRAAERGRGHSRRATQAAAVIRRARHQPRADGAPHRLAAAAASSPTASP